MKKFVFIAAAFAAAIVVMAIVALDQTAPASQLRFAFQVNPAIQTALLQEISEYQSLNPGVDIELSTDLAPTSDVVLLQSFPQDKSLWLGTATPWSGNVWVLAAQKKALGLLNATQQKALRAGTVDSKDFLAVLQTLKSKSIAPIALGNSHGWPYSLWFQTWTAMRFGPEAAEQFPTDITIAHDDFKAAIADLNVWRKNGYFDDSVWNQGWAQGLAPLAKGSAGFAIVNDAMLSAIPPDSRDQIELLPLPDGDSGVSWSLGNAQFLVVSKTTANPDKAQGLINYLTSPGVTQRLVRKTGYPFFSWDANTLNSPLVLDAWSSHANEEAFKVVVNALK